MPAIPLRSDWDAGRVRDAARLAEDAAQVRRLLAIAAVYNGMSRAAAATLGGMDRQTLRDWVHRFNTAGPPKAPDHRRGRYRGADHLVSLIIRSVCSEETVPAPT